MGIIFRAKFSLSFQGIVFLCSSLNPRHSTGMGIKGFQPFGLSAEIERNLMQKKLSLSLLLLFFLSLSLTVFGHPVDHEGNNFHRDHIANTNLHSNVSKTPVVKGQNELKTEKDNTARLKNCVKGKKAVFVFEILLILVVSLILAASSFWRAGIIAIVLQTMLFMAAVTHYSITINDCLLAYGMKAQPLNLWSLSNVLLYIFGAAFSYSWGSSIRRQKLTIKTPEQKERIILIFTLLLMAGFIMYRLFIE